MISLQDYTGNESGAILFTEDNSIYIGNWSGINGVPREFAGTFIGLGDLEVNGELLYYESILPPEPIIQAMFIHERETDIDDELTPRQSFHAISIPERDIIVVWADTWN